MKDTIDLSEEKVLNLRLIGAQVGLINVTLENLELKKQLLLQDKKTMEENYKELVLEINKENDISFDVYNLDLVNKKLIKKS